METTTRHLKPLRIGTTAAGGQWLHAAVTLGLVVAVVGCGADNPTGPVASPTIIKLTNHASYAEMVADVQGRVIASLPNASGRPALSNSFDVLVVSLQVGDVRPVKGALETANRSIEGYSSDLGANRSFDADLDVLRLSMQVIDAQLMVDMLTGN